MDQLQPSSPIEKQLIVESGRTEEVWALSRSKDFLFALYRELFDHHWQDLTWGPLIPGAAYELKCPGKPVRISLSEGGYLTIHWGTKGHFHLCLDATDGEDPEGAERRRPGRVELYRRLDGEGMPLSWGIRMFNGGGDPQITIFLPNPFLKPEDRIADQPEWDRLMLWENLFPRLTGHPTDGRDRLGKGFVKS